MSATHPTGAHAAVVAMIDTLTATGLTELERALGLLLAGTDDPAARHWAELGTLTELLGCQPERGHTHRRIPRHTYDTVRPATAPASEGLVARYGSWVSACRAADNLQSAGGRRPAAAYPSPLRGKPRPVAYTQEDCVRAIRECATELGRIPTSNRYQTWQATTARLARRRGTPARRPQLVAIYRLYGNWPDALAAADLTITEVETARGARVPNATPPQAPADPRALLAALPDQALREIGISRTEAKRLARRGLRSLPLPAAIALAHHLQGSLTWLAGKDQTPGDRLPAGSVLDPAAIRAARDKASITQAALQKAAGVSAPVLRRILAGTHDPTLGELTDLATALRQTADALLAPQGSPKP